MHITPPGAWTSPPGCKTRGSLPASFLLTQPPTHRRTPPSGESRSAVIREQLQVVAAKVVRLLSAPAGFAVHGDQKQVSATTMNPKPTSSSRLRFCTEAPETRARGAVRSICVCGAERVKPHEGPLDWQPLRHLMHCWGTNRWR